MHCTVTCVEWEDRAVQSLLRWPAGTTTFVFKTWLALLIGLYAAFVLQLEGAVSCAVCVLIVAQPSQGMVLSKAIYRVAGTLVGVVAALSLSATFPQDRTMLIAGYAVWGGIFTAIATILRDFRAYGCVLAGYTVALISIVNIDAPNATFEAAINRVAAIIVGVAAVTLANLVLAQEEASQDLSRKLSAGLDAVLDSARNAIDDRARPAPEACIALAARLMPLRSEISFASPERPYGRARAAGGRSALLGLLESINAIEAVGAGLNQVPDPSHCVGHAIDITQTAIRAEKPDDYLPAFDAITLNALHTGTIRIEDAFLHDRLRFLIQTVANVRDGLRSLDTGCWPCRRVNLPVHQDYVAVVLNAARVIVSVAIVAVLSVWSGLPDTSMALLLTGVFVALGSLLPNTSAMGNAGLYGMPIVVLLSIIYSFFVFPNIEGYPLFILSLTPLVIIMCWLTLMGQPGLGLIISVTTLTQIAPANVQTIDPQSFVASATVLIPSGIAIFMAFRLIIPVQPAQRRLRIALGIGRSLRNALADKGQQGQPRASLFFDRLSQFNIWQRGEKVTLARHKTMQRLIDLGLLAYAVRRSWRALDRARPNVPSELDAKARQILPTLSPDETEAIAQKYLALATGQDGEVALGLVHAAAALHGTAYVTNKEARLLRRVELLNRLI